MVAQFWKGSWGSEDNTPDNGIYVFELHNGSRIAGQVVESEITYFATGEIYILPVREGAVTTITRIPWRNVMNFKQL